MTEWFVLRRGLANGVLSAGTATGGLVLPLVLPPLLAKFGFHKVLRIVAVAFGISLLPLLPLLKPRLPESKVRAPIARSSSAKRTWMRSKLYWIALLANVIQAFGELLNCQF